MAMPHEVYLTLRLLHLVFMAGWLAAGLSAPSDIRRTLALGRPHVDALVPRAQRSIKITQGAGYLTVLTGVGLIFAQGGFAFVAPRIHAGFALALVALAIEAVLAEPAWRRIKKEIEGGGDLKEALASARRFSMAFGIGHLLRFVILVLMVFRF
ncbi:hypothetical protein SOCEGT47_073980 [Sorangium cellulosum]|uniref:DUF2269 family protein n=1 Tax=Sorangium cellulosum TaxID=56 RepID=A0A4P2QBY2_SORCE|nr:hypothetical protein [Sorangium cellulosum]AUX26828.1 hypothetical protein SOCEGT47_073980 [Sorangium cellulosum]